MKWRTIIFGVTLSFLFCGYPLPCLSEDMREVNLEQQKAKEELIEKAATEKAEAKRQAEKSRTTILQDRQELETAILQLETQKQELQEAIARLQEEKVRVDEEEHEISTELAKTDQIIKELIGVIRIYAKETKSIYWENLQTALIAEPPSILTKLANESSFPGIEDITELSHTLFNQIQMTSEVSRESGSIINRDGKNVTAELLMIGPFTAAYRMDKEIGFLRYSSAGRNLYALSKLPPRRMQKQLATYLDGESESAPIDIGRGAALQQLTHSLSLWEQIEKGGVIVWPILLIFVSGLVIILERIFFLIRKRFNSDQFMEKMSNTAQQANWSKCESYCQANLKKPIPRVIQAGLECRKHAREDMENVLQEAILREIPPMERFLSTLGMLAAISPLLGLLGTVTGMIDTFHVITLHGTSDPRLMSGGISEALVTTMLGLGVAIPLMLAQTLLNRSVEKEIGAMEEKAVAFVNIIHKERLGNV